jgi:hypothetical protein
MKLPTPEETISFFATIGYCVERRSIEGYADRWERRQVDTDAGLVYKSIIDLWAGWLHYAAYLIEEDDKLHRFLADYAKADTARRQEMRSAVVAFRAAPADREPLAPYTRSLKRASPDDLPRNWKSRVQHILAQPAGNTDFPERARLALLALD